MIPLYSPFIKRKDMDAVLSRLVEDEVGPGRASDEMVSDFLELFSFEAGLGLRESRRAFELVCAALALRPCDRVALPALAPSWMFFAVKALGYEPVLIDMHDERYLISDLAVEEAMEKSAFSAMVQTWRFGCTELAPESSVPSVPLVLDASEGLIAYERPQNRPKAELMIGQGGEARGDLAAGKGLVALKESGREAGGEQEQDGLEQMDGSEDDGSLKSMMLPASLARTTSFALVGLEPQHVFTAGGGCVLLARDKKSAQALNDASEHYDRMMWLPDLNASLARSQLAAGLQTLQRRTEILDVYDRALRRGRHVPLAQHAGAFSVPHGFAVLVSGNAQDVIQYARKKGVYAQKAFEDSALSSWDALHKDSESEGRLCPHARALMARTVLFPLHSALSAKSVELVSKVLSTLP